MAENEAELRVVPDDEVGPSRTETVKDEADERVLQDGNTKHPRLDTAEFVVGVGASAGGLEALEHLFQHTEPGLNCAFVVVTHLSPDFKSLLDELLKRYTKMTVKVAEDGAPLIAGVVYVIPASKEMITAQGRLFLKDRNRNVHHTLPVDVFFKSLAREYGPRAIAIILSGSGSDGSRALEDVRDHDGFVIVQTPKEAKFDGMPGAAIATGAADAVLDARDIGQAIRDRVAGKEVALAETAALKPSDSRATDLDRILKLIQGATNIDFSVYKINTIYRRVRRRMVTRKHRSIKEYVAELVANPDELSSLSDDLLIHVTEFFRDSDAFEVLQENVIPEIVDRTSASRAVRIWVPACATGEEAYSIAIQIYLEGRRQGKRVEPQIFATDLQTSAVDFAGRGIYTNEQLVGLPQEALELCFERLDESRQQIIAPIRRWIVFAPHNILSDPPFTRMDMISCRNALIYLENDAQQKALSLFNFGLKEGGFLFLGPSESLGGHASDFETISQRWRIFKKVGTSAAIRLAAEANRGLLDHMQPRNRTEVRSPQIPGGAGRLSSGYVALLDHLVPSGVLINRQRDVLHVFGDARKRLHPPTGAMSSDILRMVEPSLRVALAAGVERAAAESGDVVFPWVKTDDDAAIAVRVTPLRPTRAGEANNFLVVFDEASEEDRDAATVVVDASSLETERVERLEFELEQTRESLQATIEEVETSNEELQSTNEELMAANEELQSTNEELQSVNEELYTVNAEYQKKNDELVELSRDVENLMAATEIGVVFVDERLIIKRFTSAATEILNLQSQDVGRSLEHITHTLLKTDLASSVRQTLRSRKPMSVERLAQSGKWWQIRVIPLKAEKGHPDGAVITLYDVTTMKSAEIEVRTKTSELESIADLTGARTICFDEHGDLMTGTGGWRELTGQTDDDSSGRGWLEALHEEDRDRFEKAWFGAVEAGRERIDEHFRIVRSVLASEVRHIKLIAQRMSDPDGQLNGWTGVVVDVEDAIQSDQVVRGSEKVLQSVLRASPARISYIGADRRYRYVNDAYVHALGAPREEIVGRRLDQVLPTDAYRQAEKNIEAALSGKRVSYRMKSPRADGAEEFLEMIYEPDIANDGQVMGFAVHARDVTAFVAEGRAGIEQATFIGRALTHSDIAFLNAARESLEIQYSSPEAIRLSGYSAIDLRRLTMADLLPEYDAERLAEIAAEAGETHGKPMVLDTFMLKRNGATIDVKLKLFSNDEIGGKCIVAMIEDRTSSRAAEAALRRRTAELSRSNRMLEIFATAATHEMKEPLRKLDKFSEALFEDYNDALGDDGRQTLSTLVNASARMRRIIESVLELARVERSNPNVAPVNLDTVVEQALTELSLRIEEAGAEIDVGSLPVAQGDASQLEILFRNMIGNALTHRSPDRPIRISVLSQPDDEPGRAIIRIADNGPGVEAESVEELFLPFTQFGANRSGTGMGLALCQRIVALHGGSIQLVQTSGEGSVFEVSLPL